MKLHVDDSLSLDYKTSPITKEQSGFVHGERWVNKGFYVSDNNYCVFHFFWHSMLDRMLAYRSVNSKL